MIWKALLAICRFITRHECHKRIRAAQEMRLMTDLVHARTVRSRERLDHAIERM